MAFTSCGCLSFETCARCETLSKVTEHCVGVNPWRMKSYEAERIAAELWSRYNQSSVYGVEGVLPRILDPDSSRYPRFPSVREWQVAATIIQWLGTPVGLGFVGELLRLWEERGIQPLEK